MGMNILDLIMVIVEVIVLGLEMDLFIELVMTQKNLISIYMVLMIII